MRTKIQCCVLFCAFTVVGVLMSPTVSAQSPPTSEDGAARVEVNATFTSQTVRFRVRCPALTSIPCNGRAALRNTPTARKRTLTLGSGTYADVEPGSVVTIRAKLSTAARKWLKRRTKVAVRGLTWNETLQPAVLRQRVVLTRQR